MTRTAEKFLILGVVLLVITFGMRLQGARNRTDENGGLANAAASLNTQATLDAPGGSPSRGDLVSPASPVLDNSGNALHHFRRVKNSPVPELDLHAAVVADLESGEAFYELRPESRWPIASLTKLMTGVVVLKNMNLEEQIELVGSDFDSGGNSLTKDLKPGYTFSTKDLVSILLISSSNEAAEALARHYGEKEFLDSMNAQARAWGLTNTHFADPAGISASNQSTISDLVTLVRRVYADYPELFRISRKKSVTILETTSRTRQTFMNINEFAGAADFIGGKTGYTPDASGNLISLFEYKARRFLIIVLGTEDRFGATREFKNWFTHDFIPSN